MLDHIQRAIIKLQGQIPQDVLQSVSRYAGEIDTRSKEFDQKMKQGIVENPDFMMGAGVVKKPVKIVKTVTPSIINRAKSLFNPLKSNTPTQASKVEQKYKNVMEALNDPDYIKKIKEARNNRISVNTQKVNIDTLKPADEVRFNKLTPEDITLSGNQPVHVVKTSEGNVVVDGHHRLRDAMLSGKKDMDVVFISPEEALSRYGYNPTQASKVDPLIQEARKYKSAEEFLQSQRDFRDAHRAPGFDNTPVKKRMETGGDYNLTEVVKGQHNQPADYFDPRLGPRYYMYDDQAGMESLTAINNVKRGATTITAYRVVPKDVKLDKLIDGDWISFSKKYALDHGRHRFDDGTWKIIKQEVPAKNVWWDGNDIREWGYDIGKTKTLSRSELTDIWNKATQASKGTKPPLYDVKELARQIVESKPNERPLRTMGTVGDFINDEKVVKQLGDVLNTKVVVVDAGADVFNAGRFVSASENKVFPLETVGTGKPIKAISLESQVGKNESVIAINADWLRERSRFDKNYVEKLKEVLIHETLHAKRSSLGRPINEVAEKTADKGAKYFSNTPQGGLPTQASKGTQGGLDALKKFDILKK